MFELYKDVDVRPTSSGIIISLPWIEATVGIVSPTSDPELFRRDFYNQLENRNRLNVETLLKFPFCYILPRKLEGISIPTIADTFEPQSYSSPKALLNSLITCYEEAPMSVLDHLPSHWNWDLDSVRKQTRIDTDLYDPISIYTVIRERRHLDHRIDSRIYRQNLDDLLTQNESRFFEVIGLSLRQGLYVTENCTRCLNPALKTFKESHYEVKAFISEEEGHHKYVQQSLDELPCNQRELTLFEETRFLMIVLQHVAKYYPLAFSCIVSQFEEPGYQPYDPTALLLRKSSRPKAADGIQTHFDINKQGNHAETGGSFVLNLNAVTEKELTMAMRYSELSNLLLFGIETRLHEASTQRV